MDRQRIGKVTATTTAVLMISAKGFGPFAAPGWRLNSTVEVVDGGSNGPYLLTSQSDPSTQRPVEPLFINSLGPEFMVDAIVLLIAAQVGTESAMGWLTSTENVIESTEFIRFAPYWDLDGRVRDQLLRDFKDRIKLGIVVLEENSSLNKPVIDDLRSLGLEISLFGSFAECVAT